MILKAAEQELTGNLYSVISRPRAEETESPIREDFRFLAKSMDLIYHRIQGSRPGDWMGWDSLLSAGANPRPEWDSGNLAPGLGAWMGWDPLFCWT